MTKIILFYKYIEIPDPEAIAQWQYRLCRTLSLRGRVIIAHEGINATLGGTCQQVDEYKKSMQNHPLLDGIDFKESPGDLAAFSRLRVVVKQEIVKLGIDPQHLSFRDAGTHVTPEQAHELLEKKSDDLVIIDCRNKVESDIGTFKDAIRPNTTYFREFPKFVDNNSELFKNKKVLMFCTGGVRCERGSAYIKSKKIAQEVYHIKGGIHCYIEKFPNGFFRGKNYVFDGRVAIAANSEILGSCLLCAMRCDDYTNCLNAACNKHFIGCISCIEQYKNTCSKTCYELVFIHHMPKRPMPIKISQKPVENTVL